MEQADNQNHAHEPGPSCSGGEPTIDASDVSGKGTPAPQFRAISPPQPIPVFNCIVYVARGSDGQVKARAANLPGIELSADSEPAVLRLIITEFKRRLAQWTADDEPIPWLEPPLEPSSHEQQRLIPVHL